MSQAPAEPVSLWDKTAPPAPPTPALEGEGTCDVAIVGAGFTGLSAALHLAEGGTKVSVLEAQKIGYGGSGRNAGLVNAGMWLHPGEIVDALGKDAGERFNATFGPAPGAVFDLIERHGIDCEATRNGTIYLASSPKAEAKFGQRLEAMNVRGARIEFLDAQEVAARTGTPVYRAGLFDPDAGTINPMAYVRGLARAAIDAGAFVHAASPVKAIAPDGDGWLLTSPQGKVRADRVILATNAYTDDLWPGLATEIFHLYFCQFATKPLGENIRRTILPGGEGAWDAETVMTSFRLDAAGRLIVGTLGSIPEGGNSFRTRWAEKSIARLFPHVGRVEWDHQWMGNIAFTTDHLPRLHKLAPGVIACLGYNGRGIGPGTVMGRALAEHILSDGSSDLPVALTDPQPVAFANLRSKFYDLGAALLQRGHMLR